MAPNTRFLTVPARPPIAPAPAPPGSDGRGRSRRRLRGVKVMRPAIGVEAHRQAVPAEHLVQRPEGRGRAFLFDEKRRIDRPRRVVERENEVERLALEPFMARAIPRLRGGRL